MGVSWKESIGGRHLHVRRRRAAVALGFIFIGLAGATDAHANIEIPPSYDARSLGMGGTGVAHVENGASLAYNPAAMEGVEQRALTLTVSPLFPQLTAPLLGPNTSVEGKRLVVPAFLAGGVYRIGRKVTVGAAVFPTMGLAARYKDVPQLGGLSVSTGLIATEIASGVSYALTDSLSVGATYRITYMNYAVEQPTVDPATGTPYSTKMNLHGWNFLGIQLGVLARPTKGTNVGFTYRSKATVTMSGKTDLPVASFDTTMDFSAPHIFKVGVAQKLFDDRLALALDLRLSLYADAVKAQDVKTDVPLVGTQTTSTPMNWKNTLTLLAGAEYRLGANGPALRAGYGVSQSAIPRGNAMPTIPPPGLQQAIHVGTGMAFSSIDVNLGGCYAFSSGHGDPPLPFYSGNYSLNLFLVSLGGSYRF